MKNSLLFILLSMFANISAQNVGINSSGVNPDASAMLDIVSSNKGLLIPRVSLTATNAAAPLTSPATSMLVYNNATAGAAPNNVTPGYYYNSGTPATPAWKRFGYAGDDWSLTGNTGTSAVTNFVGTTDNTSFVFRTNNVQRMMIHSGGNIRIGAAGTPGAKIHIVDGANLDDIIMNDFNNSAGASPHLRFRKARGTQATPMSVLANWQLGAIDFDGYSGGGNILGAQIIAIAQANFASGNYSTDIVFKTNNASGTLAEVVRIQDDGDVGIGVINPIARLEVRGSLGLMHFMLEALVV